MAERGRFSHRLILVLFCVGALLGAYADGASGVGGDPGQDSFRPETPPAGGAGGSGNICDGELRRCKNNPALLCDCGYICPDKDCLPAPPYCEEAKDCPSGACQDGKCKCGGGSGLDECNPLLPDGHTYACSSEGFCMQLPDECQGEGTACGEDGVCRQGQCYERCSSDLDCPGSLVCKQDRFCGFALVPDGLPPPYSCAAQGGEGRRGAWLFAFAALAAGIRARRRR